MRFMIFMDFPSQDLDISGVGCNKMFGAKVAVTIPLGNPEDRGRWIFRILERMGIEGPHLKNAKASLKYQYLKRGPTSFPENTQGLAN